MTFSTLLLRIDINVTLQDKFDHFCRLTDEQIIRESLKNQTLIPELTQRFFSLERFNLTNEEISASIAKQADYLTTLYLDKHALCQYHVSTAVVFTQRDALNVTVNIHLSPNSAFSE